MAEKEKDSRKNKVRMKRMNRKLSHTERKEWFMLTQVSQPINGTLDVISLKISLLRN